MCEEITLWRGFGVRHPHICSWYAEVPDRRVSRIDGEDFLLGHEVLSLVWDMNLSGRAVMQVGPHTVSTQCIAWKTRVALLCQGRSDC